MESDGFGKVYFEDNGAFKHIDDRHDIEVETVGTGDVVKVENEFNNWRYVRHTAYTIPGVQRGG